MDTGITNDVLNLRTQPDAAAPITRVFPRGTVITVLERLGDWLRVQAPDGTAGFVASMFVDLQPPQPVTASRTLTPTAPSINVRSSPAVVNSPDNRIAQVKSGDVLIPLEDDSSLASKLGTTQAQNLWIRIRAPGGVTGYVAAWLVTAVGSGTSSDSDKESDQPITIVSSTRLLTPLGATLNVRSAPAVVSDPDNRIAQVKGSDPLTPLEDETSLGGKLGTMQQAGLWIKVRLQDGQEGFVAAWLVGVLDSSPNRPTDLYTYIDSISNAPPIPQGYYDFWAQREKLGLPDPFDVSPTQLDLPALRRLPINGFGPNTFAMLNWSAFYKAVCGMHNGLDHIVPTGTPLLALSDGLIVGTQASWPFLSNNDDKCIILWPFLPESVKDASGRRMLSNVLVAYGHLSDNTRVKRHDVVKAGQVIGLSGRPAGSSDNDHLHLEVHLLSGDPHLPRPASRRLLSDFKRPQPFDNNTPFNPLLFFSERLVKYHLYQGQQIGFGSGLTYPVPATLTQQGIQWPALDFFTIASYQYGTLPIWNCMTLPWPNGIYDLPTELQRIADFMPFEPYPADFL